jgi:hypothetical protein
MLAEAKMSIEKFVPTKDITADQYCLILTARGSIVEIQKLEKLIRQALAEFDDEIIRKRLP